MVNPYWLGVNTYPSDFLFCNYLFVVVSTTSRKPSGDISGLDLNIQVICLGTLSTV